MPARAATTPADAAGFAGAAAEVKGEEHEMVLEAEPPEPRDRFQRWEFARRAAEPFVRSFASR